MTDQQGGVTQDHQGHRRRLRELFSASAPSAWADEFLLELLLTYSIPQRDVRPIAERLLTVFGGLEAVLSADASALCNVDGVKAQTATLLKLVAVIRARRSPDARRSSATPIDDAQQPSLFDEEGLANQTAASGAKDTELPNESRVLAAGKTVRKRPGTGLFAQAPLKDAIELLPRLPDTESLDEVRSFLRSNLRYSAADTRHRYANYIVKQVFPAGAADRPLRRFAASFAGTQALRDVCFYRLGQAQPLLLDVVDQVVMPSIGAGNLDYTRLRDYLLGRFAADEYARKCRLAIIAALTDSGLASTGRSALTVHYRDALIPSFSFVLHSEFPTPGMYDIADLESNRAIRGMLWNPDRLLPTLYELRNLGVIAKVSEIDRVRQFTTKWSLAEAVDQLVSPRSTT